VGCHVKVHISNGKAVRIKADPKSFVPASCVRSGAALDYHGHMIGPEADEDGE